MGEREWEGETESERLSKTGARVDGPTCPKREAFLREDSSLGWLGWRLMC